MQQQFIRKTINKQKKLLKLIDADASLLGTNEIADKIIKILTKRK